MMVKGGAREGAGRKPAKTQLKKVPFNTRLPQWLRDWLVAPEREHSAPVLIEEALRKAHKLKAPEGVTHNAALTGDGQKSKRT